MPSKRVLEWRTCQNCGTKFQDYGQGHRPKKHCSPECRKAAVSASNTARAKEWHAAGLKAPARGHSADSRIEEMKG